MELPEYARRELPSGEWSWSGNSREKSRLPNVQENDFHCSVENWRMRWSSATERLRRHPKERGVRFQHSSFVVSSCDAEKDTVDGGKVSNRLGNIRTRRKLRKSVRQYPKDTSKKAHYNSASRGQKAGESANCQCCARNRTAANRPAEDLEAKCLSQTVLELRQGVEQSSGEISDVVIINFCKVMDHCWCFVAELGPKRVKNAQQERLQSHGVQQTCTKNERQVFGKGCPSRLGDVTKGVEDQRVIVRSPREPRGEREVARKVRQDRVGFSAVDNRDRVHNGA
jgi:hypothetical protein